MTAANHAKADALSPASPPTEARTVARQVTDLLRQMTAEEKAQQLVSDSRAVPRLDMPAYHYWNEGLHGIVGHGVTVFPQAIGLAATFNPVLVQQMGQAIAAEACAQHEVGRRAGKRGQFHGLTYFAPNLNIFRDPRWGRGQETYGEDPLLTGRMGVAYIRGMQGNGTPGASVHATAKHFAVHSGPETLRHGFNAKVSAHDLHDTYLPAFREAVTVGKVAAVMTVYNAINGVPGPVNTWLIQQMLRKAWKFKGYVVSDANAVIDVAEGHHHSADLAHAAAAALKAGNDNELALIVNPHAPPDYRKYLDALAQGLVTEKDFDRALRRTLRARAELGVLQGPGHSAVAEPAAMLDCAAHRQLALQLARQSMVLLKNDGLLPVAGAVQRIAVVGPIADSVRALEGNYNGTASRATTVLAGLRQQFPGAHIRFEAGTVDFLRQAVPIPSAQLCTDAGQPGLRARVFDNPIFAGTALQDSVEPGIALSLTEGREGQFHCWDGWLTPLLSGDYELSLVGVMNQLFIDGHLVIDDMKLHAPLTTSATVPLQAGRSYALRVVNAPFLERKCKLLWSRRDPQALDKAVAAAREADVVVAVVGLTADLEAEESPIDQPGFLGGDRTTIDLPAEEDALLRAVGATGKPLAVVLMSGSALAVNWADAHAAAVLQAWYPGEEGGTAVAETLAGVNNPAGRLPVTFYRSTSQLPDFIDYAMAGRTYRYFQGEALYRFGHGLSYSSFAYDRLVVAPDALVAGRPLTVRVRVRNTSLRDGDEVVQLYLSFPPLPGAPRLALRGFERVHLRAGESCVLRFKLNARDLSHVDADGQRRVSAGRYRVCVGPGQPVDGGAGASVSLQIQGDVSLPI